MRVKIFVWCEVILVVVFEVFKEMGFEGVFMVEILVCIGGFKVMLYGYFKLKEELFVVVIYGEVKKQMELVLVVLDQEVDDLVKILQIFGEKVVSFLCQESILQMYCMIVVEVGCSDIGWCFYEEGLKMGMECIVVFLKKQMVVGWLWVVDLMLVILQLCVLFDCEMVKLMMLGLEISILWLCMKCMVGCVVEIFFVVYVVLVD